MKQREKQAHMLVAEVYAQLSHAVRKRVGAVVVKDGRLISIGYNGTPSGWDNCCEDREYMDNYAGGWLDSDTMWTQWPFVDNEGRLYNLVTKPEVLHAEANALSKLAKSTESADGAAIFITCSPCFHCAKLIYQSGIKEVYYREEYRDSDGIDFLKKCHLVVEQVKEGV